MINSTHTIQGVNIQLRCDRRLHSRISNYFNFYYKGEPRRLKKSVLNNLSIVNNTPAIPAEVVREIKGTYVSCYISGKDIYYASKDGSVIHLEPGARVAVSTEQIVPDSL